jgi:hypothetical protein
MGPGTKGERESTLGTRSMTAGEGWSLLDTCGVGARGVELASQPMRAERPGEALIAWAQGS